MDVEDNVSITEPITAVDIFDDLFGFEAARKRQEKRDLTAENGKLHFKPWRIFINHIDSYHGKVLADILSDTVYVDPLSARADTSPGREVEEFEDDDEDDEEEREKRKWPGKSTAEVSRKYEVIGTVLDREYLCPEDMTVITRGLDDGNRLLSELMSCGVIIYDITQEPGEIEEACWALKGIIRSLQDTLEKSPKAFEREEPTRHFILISSIMTWALTKPLDPTDPNLPFTEADYRKRKPHPNYKEHIRCEREVVTVKKIANLKSKLRTLVVCCGITHGEGEGPLHYLFKMAWHNAPFLPVFGKGRNRIPLLHVRDLAATVSSVLQHWPPMRYIVAVEQEQISQVTIVKQISRDLTTGQIKSVSKKEALLLPEVSQQVYDQMTVNLKIDPVHIVDRIRWYHDMPFRHVTDMIIREYKAARNLRPVKIVVLGPPASGKTRVARYLANHYSIHYIHAETLITDAIQRLIDGIEAAERSGDRRLDELNDAAVDGDVEGNADQEVEEPDEEEVIASVASLREQLDEIRANMAANNGRLDDTVLNKLFLNRLKSKDCLNQGYVIDGHPKTLEQARKLFLINRRDLGEEEEEYDDGENPEEYDNGSADILPELVVVLEASDKFLKERIMNLPEREIQNTHYTEEHMLRRLREYRERNADENTPLQVFDEMEIHPLVVSVETDTCPDMFPTIYQCLEKLGKPRNYGPTAEEINAARERAEAERRAAEAAEKLRKEQESLERKREREQKMMEWTNLMEKLKQEEEERLCILAEPLQRYLARHVLPTLTEALIEVARLRPDDPVDFLAEYLFKKNPEGKMFEPDYTETMSMLLDAIGQRQSDFLPETGLDRDVAQFLKRRDELSTVDEIVENETEKKRGTAMPTLLPERSGDGCESVDGFEREESNFIEQTDDEFGDEV